MEAGEAEARAAQDRPGVYADFAQHREGTAPESGRGREEAKGESVAIPRGLAEGKDGSGMLIATSSQIVGNEESFWRNRRGDPIRPRWGNRDFTYPHPVAQECSTSATFSRDGQHAITNSGMPSGAVLSPKVSTHHSRFVSS